MTLLSIILTLIVVGIILWLINLIPMHYTIKSIINLIVLIFIIIWLLQVFGILGPIGKIPIAVPTIK